MPTDERLAGITRATTPVVLVGGRSLRFGRDKLREPWGGAGCRLVDRPIAALREVFGSRVLAVGDAHEEVRAAADGWATDDESRRGPMGGVATALRVAGGDVLVLAGDLPAVDASVVRALLAAAAQAPQAPAVVAVDADPSDGEPRLHPCTAIYRRAILPRLREELRAGRASLVGLLRELPIARAPCPSPLLANANEPGDLAGRV